MKRPAQWMWEEIIVPVLVLAVLAAIEPVWHTRVIPLLRA